MRAVHAERCKLESRLSSIDLNACRARKGVYMGIIVNLDVVMAKRKIGLTELANQVDITLANLSILKNNKAKAVRFSTLEAICDALGCQPGDILEFVPDKGKQKPENMPDEGKQENAQDEGKQENAQDEGKQKPQEMPDEGKRANPEDGP